MKTLCPSVDEPYKSLTATLEYEYEPDSSKKVPHLRDGIDAEISCGFMGFTPLYSPAGGTHEVDIISLTCLAGHAIESWTQPNGKMWLRDYVPSTTPTARVLTYGYSTEPEGSHLAASSMRGLAVEFLSNLVAIRDRTAQGNRHPIVLIGHSLGGIVIKMAMVLAKQRNIISTLPIRLIVFLATPHHGLDADTLRTIIMQEPPETLIVELGRQSPTLKNIRPLFREASERIPILSVWELLKSAAIGYDEAQGRLAHNGEPIHLVPQDSAVEGTENETSIPALATHITIAKLSQWQGSIYPVIRSMIEQSLLLPFQIGTTEQNLSSNTHEAKTIFDEQASYQMVPSSSINSPERTSCLNVSEPAEQYAWVAVDDTLSRRLEPPSVVDAPGRRSCSLPSDSVEQLGWVAINEAETNRKEPLSSTTAPNRMSCSGAPGYTDSLAVAAKPDVVKLLEGQSRASTTSADTLVTRESGLSQKDRRGTPFDQLWCVLEVNSDRCGSPQTCSPYKIDAVPNADPRRRRHRFKEWGR
jgi:hypothetical protein